METTADDVLRVIRKASTASQKQAQDSTRQKESLLSVQSTDARASAQPTVSNHRADQHFCPLVPMENCGQKSFGSRCCFCRSAKEFLTALDSVGAFVVVAADFYERRDLELEERLSEVIPESFDEFLDEMVEQVLKRKKVSDSSEDSAKLPTEDLYLLYGIKRIKAGLDSASNLLCDPFDKFRSSILEAAKNDG